MRNVKHTRVKRRKLSDEEIEQFKDFNGVRANYQEALHNLHRRPIYKNPKFFIALLIILLIAYIISEYTGDEQQTQRPESTEQVEGNQHSE